MQRPTYTHTRGLFQIQVYLVKTTPETAKYSIIEVGPYSWKKQNGTQ